ncbi:MAG: FtsX-like permease family protein [Actinomycetota bacterium]
MWRLTVRNLGANRARFAMTTFAVVLGVSFVVASFVLSDGLRSTFDDLSADIVGGTDLAVRPVSDFGDPIPLDESLLADVRAVDGVAAATPSIVGADNAVLPVKADGTTIATNGPPQLLFNWVDEPALSGFTLVDGAAPDEPGEFTMDLDAAATHGFEIGQRYDLITYDGVAADFELVGTTSFGEDNATVGATLMHVSLPQAQELIGAEGVIDGVAVDVAPSADNAEVMAAIEGVLAQGSVTAEVVDQATLTAEQEDEFAFAVTIIGNVLLGFAVVSLFVSVFIIYNTFAIVLSQRIREMALLRAIGAEARQLRRSVVAEAAAVGLVASVIGLGVGIGVARGLTAIFALIGAEFPEYPTILGVRTIVIALVLGVGVTVLASIMPARAATAISPIAGLRDGVAATRGSGTVRTAVGLVVLASGAAVGLWGLFLSSPSTLGLVLILGTAAVAVFFGLTLCGPMLARPITAAIGSPLPRMLGPAGSLATGNAGRNPRRTSTTAAALMIGLSLVTMGYVVGESVKAGLSNLLDTSITADYFVTDPGQGGFSQAVADELAASDEFGAVTGFRLDTARLGGDATEVQAVQLSTIDELFDIGVTDGAFPGAGAADAVVLHDSLATSLGVGVGDDVPIEFTSGYETMLTVAAIHDDNTVINTPLVTDELFDRAGAADADLFVAASVVDGADEAEVTRVIDGLAASYPQLAFDTSDEFQQQFESIIDNSLVAINVLLALAVIIALIGIANTLALSVHERTRELGLLRAVGMTRRQTRRMIRWEAVLVALFGAVLGVATGIVFGWGAVTAMPPETFGGSLRIPAVDIAVVVVLAAVATLVAAWLPARRAGRLNVLDAISH